MDDIIQQLTKEDGFKLPTDNGKKDIIMVVGVGGGGNNAVSHMYNMGMNGVVYANINTDRAQLENSGIPNKLVLGGLGAGDNPEKARKAALDGKDKIASLFSDHIKMVFITAGMGGGTGTGAAPVVASIAREKGLLTVGIVSIPFQFEGASKIAKALEGAKEMSKNVDALLVINNQQLINHFPDLPMKECFAIADDTLANASASISDLIDRIGHWNIDFEDVNTTLRLGGSAIISTGVGSGEHRISKAIANALESPLLKNRNIFEGQRILQAIWCNPNAQNPVTAKEMNEIHEFTSKFHDVKTITGWLWDDTLGDEVKYTLLASGFDVNLEDDNRYTFAQPPYLIFDPESIEDDAQIEMCENLPTLDRIGRNPSVPQQKAEPKEESPKSKTNKITFS